MALQLATFFTYFLADLKESFCNSVQMFLLLYFLFIDDLNQNLI